MKFNAPDHFSHSFELKLAHLPTKKSDRISLSILYPGLFFGAVLVILGLYELFNGFNPSQKLLEILSALRNWLLLTRLSARGCLTALSSPSAWASS